MEFDTGSSTSLAPSVKEGLPAAPAALPASPVAPALPFDLETLKSPALSSRELSILAIFGDALRSDGLDSTDVETASTKAAVALNTLCPPIDDTRDNYEASKILAEYLWELWTLYLGVIRTVPHNTEHPGQATVIGILDALRYLPRGTVTLWSSDRQLWHDLPLFAESMAESRGGPWYDDNPSEDAIRHWRNQNAFSARCLEAGLALWDDYAADALRDALETVDDDRGGDDKDDHDETDHTLATPRRCAILAATEWIVHSSLKLLQLAQGSDEDYEDGTAYEQDDDVPPGPRFREQQPDARAGHSGARWAFWKQQFQALLQPPRVLTDDVRAAVILAVERMEQAEVVVAAEKRELEETYTGVRTGNGGDDG